ncbi:hypothetical protein LSH36_223g04040 [Paralvinella palmiformis]|uniref:C2H2-type domain-containing protein n=1 Tax=Paralvinella palmiformis TaxID=53620 RepID=A0AAD9N5D0_9ANNE|nr:hypothetical protein LSH36_223g04040 [Paralvinella palmiformis]
MFWVFCFRYLFPLSEYRPSSSRYFPLFSLNVELLYIRFSSLRQYIYSPFQTAVDIYCCNICGKLLRSKSGWKTHTDAHEGIFRFICPYCQKGFYSQQNLQGHLVSHTGKKEFKCPVCGKEYRYKTDYVFHVRKVYSCELCGNQFRSRVGWKTHMDAHRGIFKFICSYCQRGFYNKSALQGHLVSHTGTKEFKCHICGKEYRYKTDYVYHMRCYPSRNYNRILELGLRLIALYMSRRDSIQSFLITLHFVTKEHPGFCDICGKQFRTKSGWKTHMDAHRGIFRYFCSHCQKGFYNWPSLQGHLVSHTGKKEFKCQICGKEYRYKTDYISSLTCAVCGTSFPSEHQLIFHPCPRLQGSYRYSCQFCGKRFNSTGNLRGHLAVHTGQKEFRCHVCDKEFAYKSTLLKHVKTTHGLES